jgi:hypothetical protein
MPRRQKPPGMEDWTWDEINSGRKMSKGEKKARRLAVSLGAAKTPDGRIQPPAFDDDPTYYFVVVGLLILVVIAFALSVWKP